MANSDNCFWLSQGKLLPPTTTYCFSWVVDKVLIKHPSHYQTASKWHYLCSNCWKSSELAENAKHWFLLEKQSLKNCWQWVLIKINQDMSVLNFSNAFFGICYPQIQLIKQLFTMLSLQRLLEAYCSISVCIKWSFGPLPACIYSMFLVYDD